LKDIYVASNVLGMTAVVLGGSENGGAKCLI